MTTPQYSFLFEKLFSENLTGIPKYRQLMNAVSEGISAGVWKVGDKLPTEDELTKLTPFSLGTIQKSLRMLATQGLVVREHGLGTFVAQNRLQIHNPWHCRFLADDGYSFLPVFSNIKSRTIVKNEGELSRFFGQDINELVLIDRTININKEFDVFSRFYFDKNLFPALYETPIENLNGVNFKKQVGKELSMPVTNVEHLVTMIKLNSDIAHHINMNINETCLCLKVAAYMGLNKCIYFQKFYIPDTDRTLNIPNHGSD